MNNLMNDTVKTVNDMVEINLISSRQLRTPDELRAFIRSVAALVPPGLDDSEIEQVARAIEHTHGIKAGLLDQ